MITIETMDELLECKKYQSVSLSCFFDGGIEVYMGTFWDFSDEISPDEVDILRRPTTLRKEDGDSMTIRRIAFMESFGNCYRENKINSDHPDYSFLQDEYYRRRRK